MATTYAELKTEVADFLNKSNLTSTIPTFIALAEAQIGRKLRTRDMEALATGTVSSNPIDLSSDLTRFSKLKAVKITVGGGDQILNYISPDLYFARYSDTATGVPEYYTLIGSSLYFDPAPDKSYDYAIVYYQGLQALSDSNTTNWLLTSHPDLYLTASLYQASIYLKKSEEAAGFKSLMELAINDIQSADVKDRQGGTARMISEVRAV